MKTTRDTLMRYLPGKSVTVTVLLFAALVVAGVGTHVTNAAFTSPEVHFTDASRSGLSIVPASCPSTPDYPGQCDGTTPGGGPGGSGGTPLTVSPTCTGGSLLGGSATGATCTCPSGYSLQGNSCVFVACPLGYSLQGNSCVFTGCPSGATQQGQSCIRSCVAGNICAGDGNLYYQNSNCALSSSPTQICSWGCGGNVCNSPPAPGESISAVPALIKSGETSEITWSAQNVSSCTVTGGSDSWTGISGDNISSKIESQTIFTLSCIALDGTTLVKQVTVSVVPVFQEQ